MILRDAPQRIADEAHAAGGEIVQPAEIIEDGAVAGRGEQRVHREIAAGGILAPVVGERHRRAAAVGRDIAAQRRHLDRPGRQHGGDGAVGEPGRHRLEPRRADARDHRVRRQAGREIDVGHRQPEQRIAHRAADEAGHARCRVEFGEQPGEPLAGPPAGGGQRRARHQAGSGASRRARLTMIAAVTPQIRRSGQRISK